MLGKNLIKAAAGNTGALGVEDIFSTWLYTGNGSTQTITNGIDLAGEGGMVWLKSRSSFSATELQQPYNFLSDTTKTSRSFLSSNTTNAFASSLTISSFNSTGFSLDAQADGSALGGRGNLNGVTYASWTFRKAPGFFDIVTYTGTGSARTIAHNLGSVPGCIIVKRTDAPDIWAVYHRSTGNTGRLALNATSAFLTTSGVWNNTDPTSAVFTVGTGAPVNASGGTYVAYLFAHDAGGFGDSGNESVVKCGSFTSGSSGVTDVTLGWEPQWLLIRETAEGVWRIFDNMRGFLADVNSNSAELVPNTSAAEASQQCSPSSTGFRINTANWGTSRNYIYIAIRRGPMRTPTDATKVFSAITGISAPDTSMTVGFPADMYLATRRGESISRYAQDRLRGFANTNATGTPNLFTDSTAAEATTQSVFAYNLWNTTAIAGNQTGNANSIWHYFRRAPGFFDVVAYTGTTSSGTLGSQTLSHSLGVAPELIISKPRNTTANWVIADTAANNVLNFTTAAALGGADFFETSTTFAARTFGGAPYTSYETNVAGSSYIAYLFATLPGVSKVGSYTGTGTTLNIDCGFTSGSRLVLIKRTDSTGDWYIWDTARGIIAANDPFLLLNSTAAENSSTDYIDPLSSGFQISSTAPAAINANGGSYIFLAIS